jgi:adenine-specific DNA-methyltransferase
MTTMTQKTKLELTWPGKENRPRLEPRILLEDKAFSYRAAGAEANGNADNLLIHGDNLLALKALEAKYAGKVKCVFIDPPYNTGSAFTQYDDGVEHSMWLTLMRDRLEIIRCLLSENGSLWITIDDNEAHYLKVLCDEVFGRICFIADIAWKRRDGAPNDRKIGAIYDHVLVYAKSNNSTAKKTKAEDSFNLMERTEKADSEYKIYEEPFGYDKRGAFRKVDSTGNAKGGRFVGSLVYPVTNPFTGEQVYPRKGRCWVYKQEDMLAMVADRRFFWGKDGKAGTPMRKLFKSEAKQGMTAPSIWDDVGLNQHAARELELIFGEKASFETPKPEGLMKRIVQIATNPGDLILDSFAGSGTTGAVAHKMGRRWIMVELGEHCHTHIVPRLKKVIDGTDQGGISKAVNWQGGGGFRYFRIAPSLLKKDKWGHWVINPTYNAEMLSEAMCTLMGFAYAPSQTQFWQHGYSTETDFIYVTTGSLTHDQLRLISEEVGQTRTLLICCKAFMAQARAFPNLTLKKIPRAVLHKCEWDQDDYSFSIDVLADPEPLPEESDDDDYGDDADEFGEEQQGDSDE